MLFSTRAEYGVRLMVELGRHEDGAPVALSAVAESERLHHLEHLDLVRRAPQTVPAVCPALALDEAGLAQLGDQVLEV